MNQEELAKIALDYYENGWKCFPVGQDKRPLVKGWNRPEVFSKGVVESWFYAWETKNLGISTGPSGLFVVDVDSKADFETPRSVYTYFGLPRTQEVTTPHGFHLYYYGRGPTTASRVALGIDTRGENGYVVAPPSPGYQAQGVVPMAIVPAAFLERFKEEPSKQKVETGNVWQGIEEGERNDRLFRYACRLRRKGLDQWEAVELLRFAMDQCRPPYTQDSPEELVDRVWRKW